jgi:hypothetical protein
MSKRYNGISKLPQGKISVIHPSCLYFQNEYSILNVIE